MVDHGEGRRDARVVAGAAGDGHQHDVVAVAIAQATRELAAVLKLAPGRTVRMTAMTGASQVPTVIIPLITVGTLGGNRIEAPRHA